jgi:hypothetical protein
MTNLLAYKALSSVMKEKSFITLAPEQSEEELEEEEPVYEGAENGTEEEGGGGGLNFIFKHEPKQTLKLNHRHLRNIDCLTAHTTCLVCFISTVNFHSKRKRKRKEAY